MEYYPAGMTNSTNGESLLLSVFLHARPWSKSKRLTRRLAARADPGENPFQYFLSCGIPGTLEGERYKKTPELAKEFDRCSPRFTAPARYIVFKRWDRLGEDVNPSVVIFFAPPDVLSGLFTLANFDEADLNGVYCPFCAGCGSIVKYPFLENDTPRPRAVLGMFDVSARPFVPGSTLSFSIPMKKFAAMVADMDESFLTTKSWKAVRGRIG